MQIEALAGEFLVCQIEDIRQVDWSAPFVFVALTDGELSLVCPAERAPARALKREEGWRGLRVCGALDFSLVGVLSRLTEALAGRGIPVFAVSTFDTDYLFVKRARFEDALAALAAAGFEARRE